MKRRRPEQDLQLAVAKLLDHILPAEAFWFHIPNGGKRGIIEASIFKHMGVKKGVPDIAVCHDGTVDFIELKAPGSYATPEQKEVATKLFAAGLRVLVCRTLDDVIAALRNCGVKVRLAA